MGLLILTKWSKLVPMSPGWLATDILGYVASKDTYLKAILGPVGTYQSDRRELLIELIKQLKVIGDEMTRTGHYLGYRRFVGTAQNVGTVVTAVRWTGEAEYSEFMSTNTNWQQFESLRNSWLDVVKVRQHTKRWETAGARATFAAWMDMGGNAMIDEFDRLDEDTVVHCSHPPLA